MTSTSVLGESNSFDDQPPDVNPRRHCSTLSQMTRRRSEPRRPLRPFGTPSDFGTAAVPAGAMVDDMSWLPPSISEDEQLAAGVHPPVKVALGVGAVHFGTEPSLVWTVLGSCVAVILFAPQWRISAICHAQMPIPTESSQHCGANCPHPCFRLRVDTNQLKFVTCCVEYMLEALGSLQIPSSGIQAAIIGGARMFRAEVSALSIGQRNVEVARQVLQDRQIAVTYEDVGGGHGRTLTYATATGKIKIRPPRSQRLMPL